MGFEALATTSLGLANTLGRVTVSLDDIIENARAIAEATDLPVSVDLENCGAHDPRAAATAITRAAEAGAVGGSIEDFTGDREKPIYDFSLAVERVQAAVEAARKLPFPFTLTARAETSCAAARISTTPSSGCRRSRPPARMSCTRRASTTSARSAPWSLPSANRSTW
jgi:2-methylisocitrate lyase-like PEP mutase family enzyme